MKTAEHPLVRQVAPVDNALAVPARISQLLQAEITPGTCIGIGRDIGSIGTAQQGPLSQQSPTQRRGRMFLDDRHELTASPLGKFADGRVGRQVDAVVLFLDLCGRIGVLLLSHTPKPRAKRAEALARAVCKGM